MAWRVPLRTRVAWERPVDEDFKDTVGVEIVRPAPATRGWSMRGTGEMLWSPGYDDMVYVPSGAPVNAATPRVGLVVRPHRPLAELDVENPRRFLRRPGFEGEPGFTRDRTFF